MSDDRPLRDKKTEELRELAARFPDQHDILDLIRQELVVRQSASAHQLLRELATDEPRRDPAVTEARGRDHNPTPAELIEEFLARRNLDAPTGEPLYRYHSSREELDRFRSSLAEHLDHHRISPATALAFCLWAAEWWRANYDGGPWKWQDLLRAAGHPEFAPGGGRYQELQRLVTLGLRGWGRSVLRIGQSRGFLVTLACEGGLPLKLVLRERTHLRAYFKSLFGEYRLFHRSESATVLAERVRDRLPKSLRHEVVYELSAELIKNVWTLQKELGDTLTPVRDLDESHPGWRGELPLRVSDEIARTFLNSLLLAAVEVARGGRIKVRWEVSLAPVGEEDWVMEGSFYIPSVLGRKDFHLLFDRDSDETVPARFDLCVRPEGEQVQVLALVTERPNQAKNRHLQVELLPAGRATHTTGLKRGRTLIARTWNEMLVTDVFPGASGLGELPWVFVPVDIEEGRRQEYRLAGQGSLKIREPSVLVAVPAGDAVHEGDSAHAELLGGLDGEDRLIYRIQGSVDFESADGSRTRVESRANSDTAKIEFRLAGPVREVGRQAVPIFIGRPDLQQRRDGGFPDIVPTRHLQWKPDGPAGAWGPYGDNVVGSGTLRFIEEGVVRCSIRAHIAPERAEIHFHPSPDPSEGEIRFESFGPETVALVEPEDVEAVVRAVESTRHLRLKASGPIPEDVLVVLSWGARGRLRLRLPYPATRAGFFRADGSRLPDEARVAVGSLAGIGAEAVVPGEASFEVQGQYTGHDALEVLQHTKMFRQQIPVLGGGYHSLSLSRVQPITVDRLELGDDPDGAVKLLLYSNQATRFLPPTRLFVKRFDLQLECRDRDLAVVGLDEQSRLQTDPQDVQALELEALSLLEPDRELTSLERCGSDVWHVPEESMDPGPFLVLGRQGDWHRVRPLRWYVLGSEQERSLDHGRPMTLTDFYQSGFRSDESEAPGLTFVARSMGTNAGHEDWPVVFSYLQLTSLPMPTFALLRALAEIPEGAAMLAILATPIDFELLWPRMEQLSFAWWQLPLPSWQTAFATYSDYRRDLYSAVDDRQLAEELFREEIEVRLDRVAERLPGLHPALGFLRARLFRETIKGKFSRVCRPNVRDYLGRRYQEHRQSCPALLMSPHSLPQLPGFREHLARFKREFPWSRAALVERAGRFEAGARADFADAPALAGVTALQGNTPSDDLQRQIRRVRQYDPTWFDEALRLAQLLAFGAQKSG